MKSSDTADDLRAYFGEFAPVSQAFVVMNPKNSGLLNCVGHVYFKEKKGATLCMKELKTEAHPKWKIRRYVATEVTPQTKHLGYTKKIETPPVKELEDSISEKKLENPKKSSKKDQNKVVPSQDKNNNSHFANSEIGYQQNYWDQVDYRPNPVSQPQDVYYRSVSRDPYTAS
jgi:RNA recognition motif-containing protein